MGRKLFYLFTFLLFGLSAIHAGEIDFPFNGGTTPDGIRIYDVKTDGFHKVPNQNSIMVADNDNVASMEFFVSVPEGKEAILQYEFFLQITSPQLRDMPKNHVEFTVKCDGVTVMSHDGDREITRTADKIKISGVSRKITIEAEFQPEGSCVAGSIDNMSIHIHQFTQKKMLVQAECDKLGKSKFKCDVCGKDSIFLVNLNRKGHKWIELPGQASSCMTMVSKKQKCEYCPKVEIAVSGSLKAHQFDGNGKCSVCGLKMPKRRANDSTVYEIYDASEMCVLAEMVAAGKISGNIGVDIMNDLVYSSDLPMSPLGTFDHPFQGVLNGNGHRVKGIVNYFQGLDGLGFVGVAKGTLLSHAVIANLIIDSGNTFGGNACVGGIVGQATYCDVINCASFAALEGTNYVGGIIGYADQLVSIINCAAISEIRTTGKWSTLACGMPLGHIMNSYGDVLNEQSGTFDDLLTTTLRHCFSTQANGAGFTQVNKNVLLTEDMVQALNEESEITSFDFSQSNGYPIPVVNTAITARSNPAIPVVKQSAASSRALSASGSNDDEGDPTSEKNYEIVELNGYIDEEAVANSGKTIEEVMREDAIVYANLSRVYLATRSAPDNAQLYEPVSGGDLLAFESFLIPSDSSCIRLIEYDMVSDNLVKPVAESVSDLYGEHDYIDKYNIKDGERQFLARINFYEDNNIVYSENVDGILKKVWSIETKYDEEGNATVTSGYSHNYTTGETRLEYSYKYDDEDSDEDPGLDTAYEEYVDSVTNTIHVIYKTIDPVTGEVVSQEHYILRSSDMYLLESRTEVMMNGELCLQDGSYYLYDDEGNLVQVVAFGPVDADDPDSEIRPYMYFDYTGKWQGHAFPTAIKVPTVEHQPSLQKRLDFNVYDLRGRMVRRMADVKDPFNGLPRGIYIYQGSKYLKKN